MAAEETIIKTERLVLRPFERGDLDGVAAYYSLPDAQRYLDWRARVRADCKAALEGMRKQTRLTRPGDTLHLAIVRKSDGVLVGQVSISWTDATAAQGEIRFVIAPPFRRQGYATEAVDAAISLGFDKFHFHRVFARTAGSNQPSARLFKTLGMRLEAHYREHALFQGDWDEELHFAILDREWRRGTQVKEISRHKVA